MSGDYYAPNQQVVRGDGSGPAEEGDGGSPPQETGVGGFTDEATPKRGEQSLPPTGGPFDPSEHTVDAVLAYVAAYPDDRDAVLDAERAGRGRVTLIEQLQQGGDDRRS